MSTASSSFFLDYSSDAGFRVIGSNLNTLLSSAGLVQTADTGQINWTTVTRAATNTASGYEIWRLSDSSLYFKIEYGTGSGASAFQAWITVGQGSNGLGTLTGQLSIRSTWAGSTASSLTTNYPTYVSATANHLSIVVGPAAVSSGNYASLVIGKSVDSTGAATTKGFAVIRQNGTNSPAMQSVRIASPAFTYAESTYFSVVPGNVTSSLTATSANQLYLCSMNIPDVLPFMYAGVYVKSEIAAGNTFSVAQVGSTSHTYLSANGFAGSSSAGPANSGGGTYALAVMYE